MGSIRGKKRGPYKTPAEFVHITPELVCETLRKECGSIHHSALAIGITRSRLKDYIEKNPKCAKTYKEAHEALGDVAERKLHELIVAGDVRCILWYLATKHAHRGYGKAEEIEQFGEQRRMHVSTVNIIAIPNGHYLSREQARALTIDMAPVTAVATNDHVNGDSHDDAGVGAEHSSIFD